MRNIVFLRTYGAQVWHIDHFLRPHEHSTQNGLLKPVIWIICGVNFHLGVCGNYVCKYVQKYRSCSQLAIHDNKNNVFIQNMPFFDSILASIISSFKFVFVVVGILARAILLETLAHAPFSRHATAKKLIRIKTQFLNKK